MAAAEKENMTQSDLQSKVDSFKWYHEINVGQGIKTKPRDRYDVSWDLIRDGIASIDFRDKRVLDIGTRDGKYAFEAEKRGASVDAIDNDLSEGALWLTQYFKSKVDFVKCNLNEFDAGTPYDVVLFFGVLYHLRYPMWGLRRVSKAVKDSGKLYIETALVVGDDIDRLPMLYCPVRTSPYEQTSCSFLNLTGLNETLWSFGCTVKSHKFHPSEHRGSSYPRVRRAWIEAEKTHDMPDGLQKYWESVHTSHD